MGRSRGFTLIELTVAGTMSLLVIAGGFLTLTTLQRTAARQAEINDLTSSARLAMELMARDIRGAGDSYAMLPGDCIAQLHPASEFNCPAIVDAHPWQVVIGRNTWVGSDDLPSRGRTGDTPPSTARPFDQEPENVVAYRFVPRSTTPATLGDGRRGYLGRIERVLNPFAFFRGTNPSPSETVVVLDNVLLDDQMRPNPVDPSEIDHRYDHSLFMYQVLTRSGQFTGSLSARTTTLNNAFLTPPLRFFAPGDPGAFEPAPPYAPNRPAQIVGLEPGNTSAPQLLATGSAGMQASNANSDLRMVLDRNRIRTVRISFKVVGPERRDVHDGLDLDGDPSNGTARVFAFETTVELKALAHFTEI
ncbi:PilW family protein [Vulgatibacter incomptus]|uniref:Type IV fimbrial biogenesis protein PilW n=1 Tax=Vulgatibacter incomptus TaxID=1391653 RepID=A0A0K1P9W1_9BACT|nr:type II secretion system protein [Vulgatibacter incomptus]AKU90305.1 hypothetical protein AKJ08_0692 [Vulgatibacter incomptus]